MALAMIEGAERSGRLRPGQTSSSTRAAATGSSLAFVCSLKGYPLRHRQLGCLAAEKITTMRAFGADVELLPSPEGITPQLVPRMRARAAEIAAETGGYQTDQFNNTDMVEGYRALGEELFEQLDGRLDAVCLYVGTAGCYLGTTRALRDRLPRSIGSRSSRPSRRSCPDAPRGRTGSRAVASGSCRRNSPRARSTRS